MHLWLYALLGAGGGAIVEVLSLFKWFSAWQGARRSASGLVKKRPPVMRQYVDVPAHVGMLLVRGVVGAISAAVFAAGNQIQGPFVAVALGFCGPALLGRLGEVPQVAAMITRPVVSDGIPGQEQNPEVVADERYKEAAHGL